MYNRYIPKNDGTFQRHSAPEPQRPQQIPPEAPPPPPVKSPVPNKPGSFFKNLLPREFDTSDLIVVLLLLLMAGDCEEERNTALLTLALYFFM